VREVRLNRLSGAGQWCGRGVVRQTCSDQQNANLLESGVDERLGSEFGMNV
jgi:hypothetical protein